MLDMRLTGCGRKPCSKTKSISISCLSRPKYRRQTEDVALPERLPRRRTLMLDTKLYVAGANSYFNPDMLPSTLAVAAAWARSLGGRRTRSRKSVIAGVLDPLAASRKSILRDSERSDFVSSFLNPSAAQTPRPAHI